MLYMKVIKSLNPKRSHYKEKDFYYFFNFVTIWDDGQSLSLWKSFNVCISNHYAV